MGGVFARGVDPSWMGYADLRYYHKWHEAMIEAEYKMFKGGK
jgi:hypothetical protein